MSKNITKTGIWSLSGGKFRDKTWEDRLVFKRVSWFQELTLVYDFIFTKDVLKSQFNNWFSTFEKSDIEKCATFLLAFSYSQDSKKISNEMFLEQMKKNGLEKMVMPKFYENLKMHPSYNEMSLNHYQIQGFCAQVKNSTDEILITFPGFNSFSI